MSKRGVNEALTVTLLILIIVIFLLSLYFIYLVYSWLYTSQIYMTETSKIMENISESLDIIARQQEV